MAFSAHLGVRPVQVKYLGGDGTWKYQAAIDYYQPGDAFDQGYKALVNLFYRPGGWLKVLTLAGEIEFAGQTTLDESSGDTKWISVAAFYDF